MIGNRFPKSRRGNALIEYVVPMSVLLIAVGVLATIFDINTVIGEYFMAASGHTKDSMENGTLKTEPMSATAVGTFGNGSGGFTGFATMTDGKGTVVPPGTVSVTGTVTGTTTGGTTGSTAGTTTDPATGTPAGTTVTDPAAATPAVAPPNFNAYGEATGIYNGPLLRGTRINAITATAGARLFIFDDERAGVIRPAPPPFGGLAAATTTATTPTDPALTTDPAAGTTGSTTVSTDTNTTTDQTVAAPVTATP